MDEATEHIVTMDVERRGNSGHPAVEDGPTDVDASVGALLVVVAGVLPEDGTVALSRAIQHSASDGSKIPY